MALTLGLIALLIALGVVSTRAIRFREVAGPLLIGFGLRAILAVLDSEVYRLPGQDDSSRFDYFAYYWAKNGLAGTFEHFGTGVALYTWLTSVFYAIFERSRLMMQGINVLFGSLIILNVWRLAQALTGDVKQAMRAAWLVALFPSLIFFSSVMLREVAVAYPLSLGVYHLAVWHRDRQHLHALIAILALVMSMAFHSGSLAVLLAAGFWLVGASLRALARGQMRQFGRNALALSVAALAALAVMSSGFGMEKFHAVQEGGFEDLGAQQGHFAKGRTAYLEDLRAEGPADLVWQAPLRLGYFLFAPLPWMISAAPDLVGLVDSLFFFYLTFRIWRLRGELPKHPRVVLVLGVFAAMAVTFALGVSNYGTAHRHRNKMLPLLIAGTIALPMRRRKGDELLQAEGKDPSDDEPSLGVGRELALPSRSSTG